MVSFKQGFLLAFFSSLVILLSACEIQENIAEPGISFSRVYNSNDFQASFDPLDILHTADSGYLALAATDSWTPYLLKTDQEGKLSWTSSLEEPFVSPLPELYQRNGEVFMLCMNELNLSTYILQIGEGGNTTVVFNDQDLTYPLAASITPDGGWLILAYRKESRKTILCKLTSNYQVEWKKDFDVLEDVEEQLIRHLSRTGKRLPFFTGYAAGNGNSGFYYFNGFNNFTLALTFVNPADGEPMGLINGFRDSEYINAAVALNSGSFALSKNSFGDNFFLPSLEVNSRNIASSSELEASSFPEIASDARVIIKKVQVLNRDIHLYATNSKSNRIMLYAYDSEQATLLGVEYLGQTSPYEIGNLRMTSDGGMIILGRTFVAGRFPRLCLFKLSKEEVEAIIQ